MSKPTGARTSLSAKTKPEKDHNSHRSIVDCNNVNRCMNSEMEGGISLNKFIENGTIKIQNGFPCGNWNDKGIGILHLRPFNISDLGQIDLSSTKFIETNKKIDSYILKSGDVIFNNTNSEVLVGKTAYWTRKDIAVLSNHMTILRVNDPTILDAEFLAYFLLFNWYIGYFNSICQRHVNQASVSKDRLGAIELPSINLSEQKKIAKILSTVQRAIAAQERIIQTTTELKKALMHKLFTEGLRNEPQKHTEIGPVPQSWEVVELETTGDVVYGIQAAVANNLADVGTPILTNKNITLDGGFDLEKLNYFELKTKRHTTTILQKGDILFNWRSGSKYHVGKTAYFDLDGVWVHSSFILRIRPAQKINGRYLFYYFNYLREAEFFVKLQTYAINAKFNASAVNALPTAVPSRAEQDEIATFLDSVQKKIDNADQKHAALQDLFRTLLHELMTGKTRANELQLPVPQGAGV